MYAEEAFPGHWALAAWGDKLVSKIAVQRKHFFKFLSSSFASCVTVRYDIGVNGNGIHLAEYVCADVRAPNFASFVTGR